MDTVDDPNVPGTKEKHMAIIPKNIFCPVDFGTVSETALEASADLAVHFRATLTLAHVVPMLPRIPAKYLLHEGDYERELHQEAAEKLNALVAQLKAKGIAAAYLVGTGNDVAGELLRLAEEAKADLIVMPTHGMTGWHPLVFASVAEKVVKEAHCAVLVLRGPKA
jgi:nucleotide-binding universal stress UspA family protein